MGALLMFFGTMDYKKILEQAKSPQRHASATFFLVVFAFYFVIFVVFAIIQCVDSIRFIFTSHKVAPFETAEPEAGAQPQPRPDYHDQILLSLILHATLIFFSFLCTKSKLLVCCLIL
jgi:hypothetical protein